MELSIEEDDIIISVEMNTCRLDLVVEKMLKPLLRAKGFSDLQVGRLHFNNGHLYDKEMESDFSGVRSDISTKGDNNEENSKTE